MSSQKRSGSGIFLMEMIMVCGFFLLCAALCVQVFMRSDAMSRLAREKNQAVLAAESLAETWKAEGIDCLAAAEGAKTADGQMRYTLYFDEGWNMVADPQSYGDSTQDAYYYTALLTLGEEDSGQGKVECLSLVLSRGGSHPYRNERDRDGQPLALYSLQAKKYRKQGGV